MYTLKKAIPILLFLCIGVIVQAQSFDRPNGFGGQVLFIDHASFLDDQEFDLGTLTTGFEFSYTRHLNKFVSLRLPFKGGLARTGDLEYAKNRSFIGMDVTIQATYFGNDSPVAPFAYAGYGGTKEEGLDMYTQVPVGGGLNLRIGQWGFIQLKAEYRADLNNDLLRKNMQYGIGLNAVVGPTQTTKEIEQMLSDTDGDGVEDDVDRCPDIAGRKQFGGCLDSDNDGIGDADDSCPDAVGLKSLNGCPDSDADGVADIVDDCPDVAGTAEGCPDADQDGVADAKDKCPDLAGPLGYDGCPEKPETEITEEVTMEENSEETSTDQITKESDESMKMAAEENMAETQDSNTSNKEIMTEKGGSSDMADSDGDGVEDRYDACPNASGPLAGCPDSDDDGIADYKDSCPNSKGSAHNNGCPEVTSNLYSNTSPSRNIINEYRPNSTNSNFVTESALTLMENATRTVEFNVLSDDLTSSSYEVLGHVVDLLNANPSYRLKVSGHTDDRGEDSVNQRLSEKRARACIRYLRDRGVTETQMSYNGYGARIPKTENSSEYGRSQNRRVEFELYIVN